LKRSSIVGLFVGSFYKQAEMKSLKHCSHFSFLFSVGGAALMIFMSTFIAGKFAYGASPSASSIAVIPRDQISAAKSWPV